MQQIYIYTYYNLIENKTERTVEQKVFVQSALRFVASFLCSHYVFVCWEQSMCTCVEKIGTGFVGVVHWCVSCASNTLFSLFV